MKVSMSCPSSRPGSVASSLGSWICYSPLFLSTSSSSRGSSSMTGCSTFIVAGPALVPCSIMGIGSFTTGMDMILSSYCWSSTSESCFGFPVSPSLSAAANGGSSAFGCSETGSVVGLASSMTGAPELASAPPSLRSGSSPTPPFGPVYWDCCVSYSVLVFAPSCLAWGPFSPPPVTGYATAFSLGAPFEFG